MIRELDITDLSRPGALTRIYANDAVGKMVPWIACGQLDVERGKRHTLLRIRGPAGWTDPEHDSISVVSLAVIGFEFEFIASGILYASAWLSPDPEEFRYPTAKHLAALRGMREQMCPSCEHNDEHVMVDEGYYVPKPNPEVHAVMSKHKLDIRMQIGGGMPSP